MKNVLIAILGLLNIIYGSVGYSQCQTSQLFPVSLGMTKFQTINQLNLTENVYNVREFLNYWKLTETIEQDSIYISQVNYKIRTHSCVDNSENLVLLSFYDHKLFSMTLRIWFEPKNYNDCLENYKHILESLKIEFPYFEDYSINETETGEQTGEGFWLYKSNEEKKMNTFQQASISYSIKYEIKGNAYPIEWHKTGKIDKYLLEISLIEFKVGHNIIGN